MATTSAAVPCAPAVPVVATRPTSRRASWLAIASLGDLILVAVRYYLQLATAAERIADILAGRGIDVSGRTILRWVQKFGAGFVHRDPSAHEAGEHDLAGGRDLREDPGQVAVPVPWRRPHGTGARLLVVTDTRPGGCRGFLPPHDQLDRMHARTRGHQQGRLCPSVISACAPGARHTATGFHNPVISTNRCERNHDYVKLRIRPMRGLKSFACATRLFHVLDAVRLVEHDFVRVPPVGAPCAGRRSYVRARHIVAISTRLGRNVLGQSKYRKWDQTTRWRTRPKSTSENPLTRPRIAWLHQLGSAVTRERDVAVQ